MATTSSIKATGATTTASSEFDVDSTPVSLIMRVTAPGTIPCSLAIARLMRKDSAGAFQVVDYVEFAGIRRPACFYLDAKELCVVAPGTYKIVPVDLSGYSGSVGFDKAVSA